MGRPKGGINKSHNKEEKEKYNIIKDMLNKEL